MRTTRGYVKQKFTVRLDIEKLIVWLTDKIGDCISEDGIFEDLKLDPDDYCEDVILKGQYKTDFECTYYPGNRYEPEESDLERVWLNDQKADWILGTLPEEIRQLVVVRNIDEPDDDAERVDNSGDYEDYAYEQYKE